MKTIMQAFEESYPEDMAYGLYMDMIIDGDYTEEEITAEISRIHSIFEEPDDVSRFDKRLSELRSKHV